jgi:hypothetical protein
MTVEKVRAGIAVALKQFTDRGWEYRRCLHPPDETAGPTVDRQVRSTNYDCVVIGAGVRLPPRTVPEPDSDRMQAIGALEWQPSG